MENYMQEKLKIGDTISFIMNGKPIVPGNNVTPKKPEEVKPPKEPSKE